MTYVTQDQLKSAQQRVLGAVAKLVAKEIKRLDSKFLDDSSPIERHATLIADEILNDIVDFSETNPVFGEGTKAPNSVVKFRWLKD